MLPFALLSPFTLSLSSPLCLCHSVPLSLNLSAAKMLESSSAASYVIYQVQGWFAEAFVGACSAGCVYCLTPAFLLWHSPLFKIGCKSTTLSRYTRLKVISAFKEKEFQAFPLRG
jgi:hypothetical protein